MLWVRIQDVVEGFPKLGWLLTLLLYYTLLLFHVGTNDTDRENLENIKSEYRTLGAVVKGMGTPMVFSSILPVRGEGVRRRAR